MAKTEQLLRQPVAPEDAAIIAQYYGRVRQCLGPFPKTADQTRQLATPGAMALLQLVNAIEDVLPTAFSVGRNQTAIVPQPVRQPLLETVMPAKMEQRSDQQSERKVINQPANQCERRVKKCHSPQLSPPGVGLQHNSL